MDAFESVVNSMLGPRHDGAALPLLDPEPMLDGQDRVAALNAAFLVSLCGHAHPAAARAAACLEEPPAAAPAGLPDFYRQGLRRVREEVGEAAAADPTLAERLAATARLLATDGPSSPRHDRLAAAEALWTVFFPEGLGILGHEEARVEELRAQRTVTLDAPNARPIADPAAEILFTSNVLLTVPAATTDVDALPYPAPMLRVLRAATGEAQQFWYDHPIQIGVAPPANELLYGLRGLDGAMAFERRRNPALGRVRVALSASVTHHRLRALAHDFVRHELARGERLEHLDVHLFTEDDAARLVDEVLAPAAGTEERALLAEVVGVDGEYGRHYTFLKAIAALWQVLIDKRVRATFKIDLDQVFPQPVLVAETGLSALEHLRSPLWGAHGRDATGRSVELGMIAGALVNQRDIGRGLFTPDVDFPAAPKTADEFVFFSRLPQALSTRAEMMERYDGPLRDGRHAGLERIHVTGGTNGVLVDALRRHRPFTPSFIGRAEDQAYILSAAGGEPRLAYAHQPGLIMRHDKEAFAGEAIEAARVGKLVGDDVRILYFSAYAEVLGRERVKALVDPFTGCFISRLPATVVLLRLALRIGQAFADGDERLGRELAEVGARRLAQALEFTAARAAFRQALERERRGWQAFYDTLERLERGLAEGDRAAERARERAGEIVERARLG